MSKSEMFNTYYLEDPKVKKELVDLYTTCAASCSDMYTWIKQMHWNARGSSFIGFHKMLDDMGDNMLDYADTCAELVAQMGFQIDMSPDNISELTCIPELDIEVGDVVSEAKELSKGYQALSKCFYESFKKSNDLGDFGGSNAINDILTNLNKDGWFIIAQTRTEQ